jgi:methylphosphotriester-DNA--protein-cysteine methyltransferase
MKKSSVFKAVVFVCLLGLASVAAAQGFMANQETKKYHKETCQAAKKIKQDKLVVLASTAEAQAAGYKACKRCKP